MLTLPARAIKRRPVEGDFWQANSMTLGT